MKTARRYSRPLVILCGLALCQAVPTMAQADSDAVAHGSRATTTARDGQRDFDFEFGAWKVYLSRLVEPFSGSTTWVDYQGTSVVRAVWNGSANLGELEVSGASGDIRGLSLRLYDPRAQRWNISWANSNDGSVGLPVSGGFTEAGRGVFYGQDTYNGRAIFVRFVFSDITNGSFEFEQSFSDDGGETWEPNWVARFTRDRERS
jgi:hypothetical protein